jgi:predicted phosphodiesterase
MLRIGLISDTHDLLLPQALDFLKACDRIIHAGDICGSGVLDQLDSPASGIRISAC